MRGLEKSDRNIPQLLSLSLILALVGIAMFGVFFLVVSASGEFPPPPPSDDVMGEVCYSDGTPVVSANVTLNNTENKEEFQTTTNNNGEWSINMNITIGAENGDEILITAFVPNSVEKTKSKNITVDTSVTGKTGEPQVVEDFIFTKETSGIPSLPGDGDGSASDEPPTGETKTNATATEKEKGEENISEQEPSLSEIEEKGNESVAGEGEKPSPTKEGDKRGDEGKGKSKSITGFQFMYAGAAGLTAIAALFIIRKLRGGKEKR